MIEQLSELTSTDSAEQTLGFSPEGYTSPNLIDGSGECVVGLTILSASSHVDRLIARDWPGHAWTALDLADTLWHEFLGHPTGRDEAHNIHWSALVLPGRKPDESRGDQIADWVSYRVRGANAHTETGSSIPAQIRAWDWDGRAAPTAPSDARGGLVGEINQSLDKHNAQ